MSSPASPSSLRDALDILEFPTPLDDSKSSETDQKTQNCVHRFFSYIIGKITGAFSCTGKAISSLFHRILVILHIRSSENSTEKNTQEVAMQSVNGSNHSKNSIDYFNSTNYSSDESDSEEN